MRVSITFYKMYEPGENAPPQFKEDIYGYGQFEVDALPRYQDRIVYRDCEYMVYDVVHNLNYLDQIRIKATRRVTYGEFNGKN